MMRKGETVSIEARLGKHARRAANGCLEWIGTTVGGTPRGKMTINGKTVIASRAVWEHHHGPIPAGMFVCHRCDNPPCVDVTHFFLGTSKQNSEDMVRKHRNARGSKAGTAKLTERQVAEIRAALHTTSQRALAQKFGIGTSQMHRIAHQQSWQHVC